MSNGNKINTIDLPYDLEVKSIMPLSMLTSGLARDMIGPFGSGDLMWSKTR